MRKNVLTIFIIFVANLTFAQNINYGTDGILNSWNETSNKINIESFVKSITDKNNLLYIEPQKRIAIFDLDGTLICEKPNYSEVELSIFYLKRQLEYNPELVNIQPYKALKENDSKYIRDSVDIILTTPFKGLNLKQYQDSVINYFNNSLNLKLGILTKNTFYLPMIELIEYLKENEFRVFISSYSQQSFTRIISEEYLKIKKENAIGSIDDLDFVIQGDSSNFIKGNKFLLKNEYKAEMLEYKIGESPIIVCGNSDGDMEMLQYCQTVKPHLVLILDHDDSVREYEYRKDNLLKIATKNKWTIISMKNDFRNIFKK